MTSRWMLAALVAVAGLGLVLSALAVGGSVWPRPESAAVAGAGEPGAAAADGVTTDRAAEVAGPGPVDRRDAAAGTGPGPGRNTGSGQGPESAGSTRSVVPTRVRFAQVGIDLAVRPVGVAADGQMELPADPRLLGWYRFGPAPGTDTGSAVLAGHLDSRRFGLGPLVRLREVRVGQPVEVRSSGGRATRYRVVEVARYDREGLPAEIFARSGPPRLRVVTCGGEYDPGNGGYQQNLVVTAEPVPRR